MLQHATRGEPSQEQAHKTWVRKYSEGLVWKYSTVAHGTCKLPVLIATSPGKEGTGGRHREKQLRTKHAADETVH